MVMFAISRVAVSTARPGRRRRRTRSGRRTPDSGRAHRRMRALGGAASSPPCRLLPVHAELERLRARAAAPPPRRATRVRPRRVRSSWSRRELGRRASRSRRSARRMAGQVLRPRVEDDVGALVEAAQEDRRGRGRIADDEARDGARTASQSGRVRSGFAGASTQTTSASRGRRPGLVVLDDLAVPTARELARSATPVPKYAPCGERDRRARPASASTHAVTAAVPEPKRSASPPSSCPRTARPRRRSGGRSAGRRNRPGRPVVVRPDGRAVDDIHGVHSRCG